MSRPGLMEVDPAMPTHEFLSAVVNFIVDGKCKAVRFTVVTEGGQDIVLEIRIAACMVNDLKVPPGTLLS